MVNILPPHLQSYSLWLKNQNYQTNTIRNYLFDIQRFLKNTKFELSVEHIINFLSDNTDQNNFTRHQAAIAKFCQFTLDQKICDQNLFSIAKKKVDTIPNTTIDNLISKFSIYLLKHGKSPITIKNYQSDLKQFINFCERQQLQ